MKGLLLDKVIKEDFEVLQNLDSEGFEQVTAIAAAQLHSGAPGNKALKNAAAALQIGADELSAALEALCFVITESARQQLSEQELRTALQEQLVTLRGDAIESIVQVSLAETAHARSVAADLGHPLPAFRSLQWRLDVQVNDHPVSVAVLRRESIGDLTCFFIRPRNTANVHHGKDDTAIACLLASLPSVLFHPNVILPLSRICVTLLRVSLNRISPIQMGSRCLRGQATPKMTIKLETDKAGQPTTHFLQV
jgi:hypothetical protein